MAVAVSGGGDSVALAHLAAAWALSAGRRLVLLHVDHGLNGDSPAWRDRVRALARQLDAGFDQGRWEAGRRVTSGLPAAARRARHGLLAQMARAAGARVVLTGHTADDQAETRLMRAEGSTAGLMRDWSPSPAWPEGRGLMLLRPLLDERRTVLRQWLAGRGLDWIEDPANADLRYARARARAALDAAPGQHVPPGSVASFAGPLAVEAAGRLLLPRDADGRSLGTALVVAGGGERLPRGDRLGRLLARLRAGEEFQAGLAGARLIAQSADQSADLSADLGTNRGDALVLVRETGDYRRRGEPSTRLVSGQEAVWDGRFVLTAQAAGWTAVPALGRIAALDRADRAMLRTLPPEVRASQPVLVRDDGSGPVLAGRAAHMEALTGQRLALALGQVDHERQLSCRSGWRTDGQVPIFDDHPLNGEAGRTARAMD